MSSCKNDSCVGCSKIVKNCHKNITCKTCKGYVHKKCTKLTSKQLKCLDLNEWVCVKCVSNHRTCNDNSINFNSDIEQEVTDLNKSSEFNVTEVDLHKYDNMVFNPLRFDSKITKNGYSDVVENDIDGIHECTYHTPVQFYSDIKASSGKFNFLNVNIRSLSKNFDKLNECLKILKTDFTVIGISETHLKEKPSEIYNLPGYSLEFVNRNEREKGGVCLYISDKVKYKLRKDLCHANSTYESCFIEIESNNDRSSIVGVVYRAHTSVDDFMTDFSPVIKKIDSEKKLIYMMGDFNIDLLKVDSHRPTHDYLELLYSYALIPTIYKPTRITETTATIIDNIFTNDENVIKSSILVTDITDHMPTVLTTSNNLKSKPIADTFNTKISYKRKHTEANTTQFKQKLSNVKWQEVLDGNNAEDDYDKFIETFTTLYDECIPITKCSNNRRKEPISPWITKGLLKSINNKNKLYKQYINSPTIEKRQKFKTYKNKLNMLIRKAKRKYFFKKFERSKNDMKQTWNTINNILGRGKKQTCQNKFKDDHGNVFTSPEDIANQFNDFFVNVGPKFASDIPNTQTKYYDYLRDPKKSSMYMKPIIEKDVIKIIDKFKQNKSAGNDNIGNHIIKKLANEIAHPLTCIFNLSISTGIVPEKLKIAKVIPIYKKQDAEIFSNYRPVSLLPCFSKILERLVFDKCMDYININKILNDEQFGFRSNHSTYMAVLQVVDKINTAVDNNEMTVGIFLDLSKAFDTIDHNILLHKLEYYGFRGVVLEWFKSYLSNRKQFVSYDSHESQLKDIMCGVPQGSILGPLLFILYVNDITNTTNVLDFTLFADDTTLLYSHKDIASQINMINEELDKVSDWFKANKLSVNASKTNYMILGTPHMTSVKIEKKLNIRLNDKSLERVEYTKFLGVLIDENLTWKKHIDCISKTLSRNIGIMNKLKHFIPERILYSLYCTFVLPYLNYGILIWGNTCKTYLDKLIKLQKWAVRVISNSHYRSHANPLFQKYNILNVEDMHSLELGVFMYKYSINDLPYTFHNYFSKRSDIHDYQTRFKDDLNLTNNKKVFSDQSIRTSGPILWNSLNKNLKCLPSIKSFRKQFKSKLISKYN